MNSLFVQGQLFSPFNLIVGDYKALYFLSSREARSQKLDAGVYGVSNGEYDSAWPKVEKGKKTLQTEIEAGNFQRQERLFSILVDKTVPKDETLPDTGVGLKLERQLAPVFIRMGECGMRASIILTRSANGKVSFSERNYASDGTEINTKHYDFTIKPKS